MRIVLEPGPRLAIRHIVGLAATYLALSVVMLHPISNVQHLATASYAGDARLNIWTLAWANHVFEHPGLALFDANIFFPARETFAYSEHLVGIAAFSFPVYAITHNPTLAYNLVWFAAFVLNGVAAHVFLWRVTRSHVAALVGGTGFAFSFFNMLHGHGHIQLIWSFWMPIVLIAMDAWVRTPSWTRAGAVATSLILQMLASWYMAVLVLVLTATYVPFAVAHHKPSRASLRTLSLHSLAIAVVLALCITPFARHYLNFPPGPTTEAAALSAHMASYLVPPEDTWIGSHWPTWFPGTPGSTYGETTLFVGYTRLILATVGLVWVVRRRRTTQLDAPVRRIFAFACVLIVIGGWLSFGPAVDGRSLPSLYDLFVQFPGMRLFRAPGRFALLLTFGMAIASAVGALALGRRRSALVGAVVLVLLVSSLAETYLVRFPAGRPQPETVPKLYTLLRGLAPGAVVSLPFHLNTTNWWREADYQFYSTVHWRPIVNGYSRREPAGFSTRADQISTFPAPASAAVMRDLGVGYLVLHMERYEDGAGRLAAEAEASPDFSLIARDDHRALYAVRPEPRK